MSATTLPSSRWTRVLDVALCLVAAPIALLVALLVGLAVRASSTGPALYRGCRVGRHGEVFSLYKFRTMHVGADGLGPGITLAGDPRVTWLGRYLRRSKLDELPQIVNVLRGDMSLVGPRPEAPAFVDLDDPLQALALSVRPGLTSPASLAARDEAEHLSGARWEAVYRDQVLPAKLQLDCAVLSGPPLRTHLGVLALTAAVLLGLARVDPLPLPRLQRPAVAPGPST